MKRTENTDQQNVKEWSTELKKKKKYPKANEKLKSNKNTDKQVAETTGLIKVQR